MRLAGDHEIEAAIVSYTKLACFQPSFVKKKYWVNHVKHDIIWKLKIYSININPGKLNVDDCLVIGLIN